MIYFVSRHEEEEEDGVFVWNEVVFTCRFIESVANFDEDRVYFWIY